MLSRLVSNDTIIAAGRDKETKEVKDLKYYKAHELL